MERKTTLGLAENIEAALAYLLGWVSGLLIFYFERKSRFVRFNALQSTVVFLGLWVLGAIIVRIPVLNILYIILIIPISLVLWVFLIIKAYLGQKYKLPYLGDFIEKQLK